MIFSMKNSLKLLRRTIGQLVFLWLVYMILVVVCALFITSVVRDLLDKSAEDLLKSLDYRVTSDLLESETALRSTSLHILRMIQDDYSAPDVHRYMRHFTEYVLADNRRITGVEGMYGVFEVFDGVFMDGTGSPPLMNHLYRERLWYKDAVAARGDLVVTLSY